MKTNFFKTTAFKCVSVLLVIMLISGGLLAVLNDLLFVSPEEQLSRAIKKIYGAEITATETIIDETKVDNSHGEINKIYDLADGNKLFNTTGTGGYHGGSVTLWIVVGYQNNSPDKLNKIVLDSYKKQTRMGDFKAKFYNKYTDVTNDFLTQGGLFSTQSSAGNIQNIVTGATYTSVAANNAVNTVLLYVWGEAV